MVKSGLKGRHTTKGPIGSSRTVALGGDEVGVSFLPLRGYFLVGKISKRPGKTGHRENTAKTS